MTGFDKPLHEMELKIHGSVYKKMQSMENSEEIEIGDTVAVLQSQWNKWVRAHVKEIDAPNGLLYVWLPDYGLPMISKRSETVKLPPAYVKMNMKNPRIYVGGLINCVPAEGVYEYQCDNMVVKETSNWSKKAIEIVQKAIDDAIHVKFENAIELKWDHRVHRFGHLKCQKSDGGLWTDLNKCLANAMVATLTTDDWLKKVPQMESINQPEWKTNGGALDNKTSAFQPNIVPTNNEIGRKNDQPNQSMGSSTSVENKENANGETTNGNQTTETKPIGEEAKANKKPATNNVKTNRIVPSRAPKGFAPFSPEQQGRPFQPYGMMRNIRGFGLTGSMRFVHRGGNRWANPRGRNSFGGRMSYADEQEYFESCFYKRSPCEQKQEPSTGSLSNDDDDNTDQQTATDEAKQDNPEKSNGGAGEHDDTDQQTANDEAKQENPEKSNCSTGEHQTENEIVAAAPPTESFTATIAPAADIVADNSTKSNDDKAKAD